jgi:hypothetical protein
MSGAKKKAAAGDAAAPEAGGAAAPEPGDAVAMIALTPIEHDGTRYEPGAPLSVPPAAAERLRLAGAAELAAA